jgi:succinate dehydrogenase / fumarate reductase iron-sulfur subunit
MRRVIDVVRRATGEAAPYHQRFVFETADEGATVATALRELNDRDDLCDEEGRPAASIRWESSCLQRRCGACAMVISGVPRLACDTLLADLGGEVVTLEPLRTFPVVADLVVDRQAMLAGLREAQTWLDERASLPDRRWDIAYEASRCLQCGLCLEVCPNYSVENAFGGMAQMASMARLLAEASPAERSRLAARYRFHVFAGCGKSLACRDVCPASIDIDGLLSRSNAAALWRRW